MPLPEEWQIEKLVPGGAGYARLPGGQSAFARGALPGERIRVDEVLHEKNYLVAQRFTLVTSSPERVSPACPVQERCGGCDFMTLAYPAQLAHKTAMLCEALRRTGRFQVLPEVTCVPSDSELGYRRRIRLHVDTEGRIGFFSERSRELVEIGGCPVAHPELDRALSTLRELARPHARELSAYAEIELRLAHKGPNISIRLGTREHGPAAARRNAEPKSSTLPLLAALRTAFHVEVTGEAAQPENEQRFSLPGGVEVRAPVQAFTQVNWDVNALLVSHVVAGARARRAQRFCDLYSGVGNFSLPLLAAGLSGVSVEANREATGAAERAARQQGLGGRFLPGDVERVLSGLTGEPPFDLVVLDPPRSGARQSLASIASLRARAIAYCACDPVTLARDLRGLCDRGYALVELALFDMFPQTHHFETVAWLERRAQ